MSTKGPPNYSRPLAICSHAALPICRTLNLPQWLDFTCQASDIYSIGTCGGWLFQLTHRFRQPSWSALTKRSRNGVDVRGQYREGSLRSSPPPTKRRNSQSVHFLFLFFRALARLAPAFVSTIANACFPFVLSSWCRCRCEGGVRELHRCAFFSTDNLSCFSLSLVSWRERVWWGAVKVTFVVPRRWEVD